MEIETIIWGYIPILIGLFVIIGSVYLTVKMKNIIGLESDYRELKLIINRLTDLYEFNLLENKNELYLYVMQIGLAPYRNSINFRLNVPNKFGEYLSYGLPIFLPISANSALAAVASSVSNATITPTEPPA